MEHRQEVEHKHLSDQPDAKPAPTSKPDTSLSPTAPLSHKSNSVTPSDDRKIDSIPTQLKSDTENMKKSPVEIPNKDVSTKSKTKSILKREGSRRSTNRISFDPLALLLDASLEGEVDLVKKVSVQVCYNSNIPII